jgi:cellobiose-specific phosphotransferase system component IIC
MSLDDLPIHWGAAFQVLSIATIFLMLWEADTAKRLDHMRWNGAIPLLFQVRRATMMLKALTLCWAVIYSHSRGWQPWPPIVAFLVAFAIYVVVNTLVMRADMAKMKEQVSQSTRRQPANPVSQR